MGDRRRFRPPRGGAPAQPPSQPLNENLAFQNPNIFPLLQALSTPTQFIQPNFPQQNLNFTVQNPAFLQHNPNIHPQHAFNNTGYNQPQPRREGVSSQIPMNVVERADQAVVKARRVLLAAGQSVSTWKVSQSTLLSLQVDSWSSLGCQMQEIPSLCELMKTEGRINAFIHCFVGVWRITSLYDLEIAICKNESIEKFEELELGPLLRHPLVLHYFSPNPDATEVFKITCEDIVAYLYEFIDTYRNGEIRVDEFLDFIAKKQSVMSREVLGVRIQNFGMYIGIIRTAMRQEAEMLKKFKHGTNMKERYISMSKRVQSFYSVHKDFCGKHIRFDSSSSEEEDADDCAQGDEKSGNGAGTNSNLSSEILNCSDRGASSCPYPSATEELARLGLKDGMKNSPSPARGSLLHNENNKLSKKKRKIDSVTATSRSPKAHKRLMKYYTDPTNGNETLGKKHANLNDTDILLSGNSIKMFVTTWKEACRKCTATEVLQRMLQFYKPTARKGKRLKSLLSSYPFKGLLNVAVASIKNGMWDSIYDTIQATSQHELTNMSDNYCEYESIEVEPSVKDASTVSKSNVQHIHDATPEEVITKISAYFEHDHETQSSATVQEMKFILLKKLCNCGPWLAEQFSVKEFASLGYGDLFTFLEKHVTSLPIELQKFLCGDICDKSPLEVCILQHLLVVLVSQASYNLCENEVINKEMISTLLMNQFPLLGFKIMEYCFMENFLETVERYKNDVISKCVLFSASLFGGCRVTDSLANDEKYLSKTSMEEIGSVQKARTNESVTSQAVDVLLRAPMLSDLASWSHWDLVFAPSLGPLVVWLLNEVNAKELLCLVTKDGKVIRVDPLATLDSFLEAALKGSSFETAVKLLSLFSLSGGVKHLAVSVLKCHSRQAFEVMLKNQLENVQTTDDQHSLVTQKALLRQQMLDNIAADHLGGELKIDLISMSKAVSFASRFILDCLGYLPVEFCGFAADILLYGFRSVVKDAPSVILSECNQLEQRFMLHEVGLSLGIVEWIQDYHAYIPTDSTDLFIPSEVLCVEGDQSQFGLDSTQDAADKLPYNEREMTVSGGVDEQCKDYRQIRNTLDCAEVSPEKVGNSYIEQSFEVNKQTVAAQTIESIRREEFGLDQNLSDRESNMLKKQHARLGRSLHCLSQELYSQDSHFLLELVQNADDNIYSENVEPTLTFILQELSIVVLNNEQGFSAQNIRALCDIGNSTKKGCSGYIGKKGIGFKSVFRITDAPEIHSNGFHVKFDISDGQIGFVLPTVVPPCDVNHFRNLLTGETSQLDSKYWNTCILLPFRSKISKGIDMASIMSLFTDLHPSLLLFLHRLQCIIFRNMLNNSLTVMRKEIIGNGIVKVSCGKDRMTWFVASQKLQANVVRPDVKITEIAVAFTLQELDNGFYGPLLDVQPVFAFLPLRTYGLKFILQGDFVLPSSREEVDGDSPWNQWLLSEFPGLIISAEKSLCALPCFRENPGKAVTVYMSFVPLVGEVHGFFSCLPRMIISKLRMSRCLLLEGDKNHWVPPCKVLRGWNEQARSLFPDDLVHEHLGLGFLDKDIVLSDSLARALGIEEYGPKVLVQILSSLCERQNGLKAMSLRWLSSLLNEFYALSFYSSGQASIKPGITTELIDSLRRIPFIPLSDGTFSSVNEGAIWLHSDIMNTGVDWALEAFPRLNAKLRFVNPGLLSVSEANFPCVDVTLVGNITRVLHSIGIQQLSAHEIIKVHILPALTDDTVTDSDLMIDYLCFVMIHLQSSCSSCCVERKYIISELKNKAFILTNHGFKKPSEVSVHFSKEYDNPVTINKLISGIDMKWHEVDATYLNHPACKSQLKKWREFFQDIGVTDFVQVVQVDKNFADISHNILQSMSSNGNLISPQSAAKDWESYELVQLLSQLSTCSNPESCKYMLEVLDKFWDDYFSEKVTGWCNFISGGSGQPFQSSFMRKICDVPWVASSMDDKLHYPRDLFHDCDTVRCILGASAPYAVPKVRSGRLVNDFGFKTQVSLDDVLEVLKLWRTGSCFKASIAQMSRLYSFIWNEMPIAWQKVAKELGSAPSIFVPCRYGSRLEDVVSGLFLSSDKVYWNDPTGSMDQIKEGHSQCDSLENQLPLNRALCSIYPSLHDFFVNHCGVPEKPSFLSYLDILRQLSRDVLPSQAAKSVFQVFVKWADALKSGLLSSEDINFMKKCLDEEGYKVLPTILDKWVSLQPSIGLICWPDDEKLRRRFKHLDNIDFLYFGNLNDDEQEFLRTKVSVLMRSLGIPILSEVVTREAIPDGQQDCSFKASLVNWALPFAQRYLHSFHPNKYFQLKQSGFDNINKLQIVVVRKLYYSNVIKSHGIVSKKRIECSCLLQGDILYTTEESDSHALFMELSRLLFEGTPDLHLANFLNAITTMAESGLTEEQTESYILRSHKVAKLRDGEVVWSLSSIPFAENSELLETNSASTVMNDQCKLKRKTGIYSNWPPVDWKTAPGFSNAYGNGFNNTQAAAIAQPITGSDKKYDGSVGIDSKRTSDVPIEISADMTTGYDSATTSAVLNYAVSENMDGQFIIASNQTDLGVKIAFDSGDLSLVSNSTELGSLEFSDRKKINAGFMSSEFCQRDKLHTGTPNAAQASLTGKLGELAAFKYFSRNLGKTVVKWVNKDNETGLPYDLLVEEERGHVEYIEVKSTKSRSKDWFHITTREWQFATEKAESFTIAHVLLLSETEARVTVYKDLVKLCQLGKLQLAVLMPKQRQDVSIVP